MNKQQQRQLYRSVSEQLTGILRLVGDRPNKKRISARLSRILDIITESAMKAKRKSRLVGQVEEIMGRMAGKKGREGKEGKEGTGEKAMVSKTASESKTKRYGSSGEKALFKQKVKRYDKQLNHHHHLDNLCTLSDSEFPEPSPSKHQLRSLKIKNQILQQQVQLLKSRIRRLRESSFQSTNQQTLGVMQSQLRESYRKHQDYQLRINQLTKELAQKDTKIQQLQYNNTKLSKLLRVKEEEGRESRRKFERERTEMEKRVERMRRYEVQARAFEVAKEAMVRGEGGDGQLKEIIRKYKTFIK